MSENTTKTELLPCPFCGSPAEIEDGSDHHGEWFNLGCSQHWGRVEPDEACIAGRIFYTEFERDKDTCIALWNRRSHALPTTTGKEAIA